MSDPRRVNLLTSRGGRRLLFAALYFSEGAPIGFLWWALPAYLRESGVEIDAITKLTAVMVLPWALKFLWAPLVDTLRSDRWGLRAWIITAQLMMGVTLLPLLDAGAFERLWQLQLLLVAHALCAATQDVAVDALCIANVSREERGSLNGWMQAGMLLGRAAFGGGALLLFEVADHRAVIAAMIAATWCSAALVAFAARERKAGQPADDEPRLRGFADSLRSAASRPTTWLALAFAGIAGAGFEAIGAVAGIYLVDRGVSPTVKGVFFAGPTVLLMMAGALLGGWAADRFGKLRVVAAMTVAIAAAGGLVALAAWIPPMPYDAFLFSAYGVLYFVIGMFTASSYALLMDLTDPKLGATQFSAYMGATNLCEAWAAFVGGKLIVSLGYPAMFAIMSGVTLAALPVLVAMRRGAYRSI